MRLKNLLPIFFILLVTGCASTPEPYDYTEFKKAKPASILVLPPTSSATDLNATESIMSAVTFPLAEGGYYVFPVSLVMETFAQNGLTIPDEIHDISLNKLIEIFDADAVLYININKYGSSYRIIQTVAEAQLAAKLVGRNGQILWAGTSYATTDSGSSSDPIAAMLGALIGAIASGIQDDPAFQVGVAATNMLLTPNEADNRLLTGPRAIDTK